MQDAQYQDEEKVTYLNFYAQVMEVLDNDADMLDTLMLDEVHLQLSE
jgi:hypothetical protein